MQIKHSAKLSLAISGLSYEPDIPRFKQDELLRLIYKDINTFKGTQKSCKALELSIKEQNVSTPRFKSDVNILDISIKKKDPLFYKHPQLEMVHENSLEMSKNINSNDFDNISIQNL